LSNSRGPPFVPPRRFLRFEREDAAVPSPSPIFIATPLEPELVARIAAAVPDAEVLFDPHLLPPARYPSDHRGVVDWQRNPVAEAKWLDLLGRAVVVYGVPSDTAAGLAAALPNAPLVRWVQATSAGAGEQVRAARLDRELLARVSFTSAAGVHGGMLAEFVFGGILSLRKEFRRLERIRADRAWTHFASGELDGSTIAVVGMGSIGTAVARIARAFGMRVLAVTRTGDSLADADAAYPTARMGDAFEAADAVAVTLPGTALTEGLVDRSAIERLRPGAVFCNVGRGSVVDQVALTQALQRGAIAGAVLDVFNPEPLPPDDPLWTLENVVFSPHTMALSVRENERIVDLFCDNLDRFARDAPLRNRIDTREFY
jgi:phosphoglycerate dehydrogenase-like enzyme